ncbi:uncharacterized protein SPSK_07736 [Sporothrix schenckii 1099-18]|uniref:Uncharacterized protein n=1 Tax=Sporothrix schenckii 1099-18 TaxID=1397361 RepID=A0A0F2MLG0_SPOSC|nr:uncharacterized protein SPSK_07736 [Sporothrix schenckii 1099-18]KJR89016.1 hypothetical protein SPSK_07736 [Sporothrix schenckii 1099-18]
MALCCVLSAYTSAVVSSLISYRAKYHEKFSVSGSLPAATSACDSLAPVWKYSFHVVRATSHKSMGGSNSMTSWPAALSACTVSSSDRRIGGCGRTTPSSRSTPKHSLGGRKTASFQGNGTHQDLGHQPQVGRTVASRPTRYLDGDLAGRRRRQAALGDALGRRPDRVQPVTGRRCSDAAANVGRWAKRRPVHAHQRTVAARRPSGREAPVERVQRAAPEIADRLQHHACLRHRCACEWHDARCLQHRNKRRVYVDDVVVPGNGGKCGRFALHHELFLDGNGQAVQRTDRLARRLQNGIELGCALHRLFSKVVGQTVDLQGEVYVRVVPSLFLFKK